MSIFYQDRVMEIVQTFPTYGWYILKYADNHCTHIDIRRCAVGIWTAILMYRSEIVYWSNDQPLIVDCPPYCSFKTVAVCLLRFMHDSLTGWRWHGWSNSSLSITCSMVHVICYHEQRVVPLHEIASLAQSESKLIQHRNNYLFVCSMTLLTLSACANCCRFEKIDEAPLQNASNSAGS